jgi:hypothetical protein
MSQMNSVPTKIYYLYFFLRTYLTAEVFLNHSGLVDHIQLTHTVGLLSSLQRPLPTQDNTTYKHDIHAPSEIRTRDPSNQAAADLRLRSGGYRGRLGLIFTLILSFHPWLGLPNDLFRSGLRRRYFVCISYLPHACYMHGPSHCFIWLHF